LQQGEEESGGEGRGGDEPGVQLLSHKNENCFSRVKLSKKYYQTKFKIQQNSKETADAKSEKGVPFRSVSNAPLFFIVNIQSM
jgi:hypothetical protein